LNIIFNLLNPPGFSVTALQWHPRNTGAKRQKTHGINLYKTVSRQAQWILCRNFLAIVTEQDRTLLLKMMRES